MASLGLGKEGGKTTSPSERSGMSVWMSVGLGQSLSLALCLWVPAVALCVQPSFPSH